MWNILTSCDCDVISIPAISRSLPCPVWGAHIFFFLSLSPLLISNSLAVILVGSLWYQMTLVCYFSLRVGHCMNDVASIPDVYALRIFANVQSVLRCNLQTFYSIAKQHFHDGAVSADQCAKGVPFCSVLGKSLVGGGDWSVYR